MAIVFPNYATTMAPPSAQALPNDDPMLTGFNSMLKAASDIADQYEQRRKVKDRANAVADALEQNGKTLEASIYRNMASTAEIDRFSGMGVKDLEAINDKLFSDALDIAKIETAFGHDKELQAGKMRHELDVLEKDYGMKLDLTGRQHENALDLQAARAEADIRQTQMELESRQAIAERGNELMIERDINQHELSMNKIAQGMALDAVNEGLLTPEEATRVKSFGDLLAAIPNEGERHRRFIQRAAERQELEEQRYRSETRSQIDRLKDIQRSGIPGAGMSGGNATLDPPSTTFRGLEDYLNLGFPGEDNYSPQLFGPLSPPTTNSP